MLPAVRGLAAGTELILTLLPLLRVETGGIAGAVLLAVPFLGAETCGLAAGFLPIEALAWFLE